MARHPAKCPKCGGLLQYESAVDERLVCPGCQVLLSVPGKVKPSDKVDPLLGQTLGQFELLELLGRGGMGAVYKARQVSLNRLVAVKVLPRALARDAKFVERFLREARDAAAVSHPNIVPIYDVGQDKGFQFIAMEFVEGESLSDLLKRDGPLPAERALDLFKQVTAALAKAHAAGIVHRDIKPANILVTSDGHAKLADFGLAKRPDVDVSVTQTGAMMGTPLYFPPEAARGERYDARSDLYSLGATFYHLLAGKPPFEGENALALAVKHSQDPVPPLKRLAPATPAHLCGIIHRLLQKKASDRFQSADELLEALNRVAQGRAPSSLVVPPAGGPHPALASGHAREDRLKAELQTRDADRTMTADGHHRHVSPDERRAAKAKARKKLLLLLGGAAAALVLVVSLVLLLRPGPRQAATHTHVAQPPPAVGHVAQPPPAVAPPPPTPKVEHPTPPVVPPQKKAGPPPKPEPKQEEPPKPEPKKQEPPKPEPKKEEPPPPPKEDPAKNAESERLEAARKAREEIEKHYAEALKPVEALVARWDFSTALDALSKLNLDEIFGARQPTTDNRKPFADRLATRRDELERLAKLKLKMIEPINTATPKLRKGSLLIPGINADLVKADERAITAELPGGKTESHEWPDLTARSVEKLLGLTVDGDSGDDHLAAGILFLSVGGASVVGGVSTPRDASAAEAFFEKARSLGASIDRYLDPLAAAAFASAQALLAKGDFRSAQSDLSDLEKKYEKSPWLAAHKDDVAAARDAAKTAIAESEAEKLYAEATKLFAQKELFDLKPIIEKLKTAYPNTRPVTDETRKPSFAEMAKATESLGKFITVRQDGKGDFTTIQAAIDAAPTNSVVEIQDSGTYDERIVIDGKDLTLRGRRGCWPAVTYRGQRRTGDVLVSARATRVDLAQLIILAVGMEGIGCESLSASLRRLIVHVDGTAQVTGLSGGKARVEHSLFVAGQYWYGRNGALTVTNSFLLTSGAFFDPKSGVASFTNCVIKPGLGVGEHGSANTEIRQCTIPSRVWFSRASGTLLDCVVLRVESREAGLRVDCCNVYDKEPFWDQAKAGKGCLSAAPQFRDPANFDYRLKPTSPCRKKASDGGDIGCRYTPEMMEVLEKALELRKKGIIKF